MKGYAYYSSYTNIARTVQQDAACGFLKKGNMDGCGYSLAKASRDAKANMDEFLLCARQFLATVGDKNCQVEPLDPEYQEWTLGFTTRRVGDHLYVTEATEESALKPGHEIYAIANRTIPEMRKEYGSSVLWDKQDEREDWDLFLRMFETMEVFPGDGSAKRVYLQRYPVTKREPELSCTQPAEGVVLLKVESFADADAVAALISENQEAISTAERLILDLRRCEAEGEAESFLPLLPYLCDRSIKAGEIFPTREIYTSYSKQNVQRRLCQLEALKEMTEAAEEQAYIDELISDVAAKAHRVRELQREKTKLHERIPLSEIAEWEESGIEEEQIEVGASPARVVILTDVTCGYAGEWLVQAVHDMEKVTVVGRPTAGMLDYCNPIAVDYEDIMARLIYPISRTKEAREGNGVAFRGVPVDEHIPFTREECTRDILLERALQI